MRRDFPPLARIGIPAILTNIATPVGNGYMTAAMAPYGDAAVAAWTIISRLVPVAFGGLFALSGAVGPVVGQNFGAHLYDRVRKALTDSLIVSTVYVVVVSAIILLAQHGIIRAFGVTGEAAGLVLLFCRYLAITFIFAGGLYVSNAAFNNLNYPALSTLLNWGRATLGTVPFVIAGAWIAGKRERSPASSSAASRSASSRCSSPTGWSRGSAASLRRATKRTCLLHRSKLEDTVPNSARPRASGDPAFSRLNVGDVKLDTRLRGYERMLEWRALASDPLTRPPVSSPPAPSRSGA